MVVFSSIFIQIYKYKIKRTNNTKLNDNNLLFIIYIHYPMLIVQTIELNTSNTLRMNKYLMYYFPFNKNIIALNEQTDMNLFYNLSQYQLFRKP